MMSVDTRRFNQALRRVARNINPAAAKAMREGSERAAVNILGRSQELIQTSPGGGSVRRMGDTASLPGDPPRTDTGTLVRSGRVDPKPYGADVVYSADYAVHLEMGTRNMEPRPFLAPAIALEYNVTAEEVGDILARELRR